MKLHLLSGFLPMALALNMGCTVDVANDMADADTDTDTNTDTDTDTDSPGDVYVGVWQIAEVRPFGQSQSMGPDTSPGVAGTIRISSNGDGTGALDIQAMDVSDGVPTDAVGGGIEDVAFEPGLVWILLEDNKRQPYTATVSGDTLRFEFNEALATSAPEDGPALMVLTRLDAASPWIGDFSVTAVEQGGDTQMTGVCEENNGHFERFTVDLSVDERFVLHEEIHEDEFSDSSCSNLSRAGGMTLDGLVTTTATRFRLLAGTQENNAFRASVYDWAYQFAGDTVVLTDGYCLPADSCGNGMPDRIVMVRQP